MFPDLVKKVDGFVEKYGDPTRSQDRVKMKADVLDLVQAGIEHGEQKDQNKIVGIVTKGIKAFLGRE